MNFIALSSLPKSGSTLLLYILNQNPKFTIGPDSEISYFLDLTRKHISKTISSYQIPHQEATECFLNYCRSGTDAWIDVLRKKDTIFLDKSRGWILDLDFTLKVFPNLKVIINIRDLRSILNSFEKVHSNSIFSDKKEYYADIDTDLQRQRLDGILNFPTLKDGLTTLRELIEVPKKYGKNILITRHEDLIEGPDFFMKTLYDFLELPFFQHNFENIEQDKDYNDNPYMPYGNHKIKSVLDTSVSTTYDEIRPDLLEQIMIGYSWYYRSYYSDRM